MQQWGPIRDGWASFFSRGRRCSSLERWRGCYDILLKSPPEHARVGAPESLTKAVSHRGRRPRGWRDGSHTRRRPGSTGRRGPAPAVQPQPGARPPPDRAWRPGARRTAPPTGYTSGSFCIFAVAAPGLRGDHHSVGFALRTPPWGRSRDRGAGLLTADTRHGGPADRILSGGSQALSVRVSHCIPRVFRKRRSNLHPQSPPRADAADDRRQ